MKVTHGFAGGGAAVGGLGSAGGGMGIAAGFAPRAYDNRALIVAIEALLGEGGPGLNLTNVALARKLLKELT